MPKMYIISGCNGAGKTTAAYTILPDIYKFKQFVNSDEIARILNPANPDSEAIRASRILLERMNELIERGEDFCVETTLATRTLLNTIKKAQQKGYYVTLIFFFLKSADMAVARVKFRVESGGHNVPEPTIRRRYEMGIKNFFNLYMPQVDCWYLVDNTPDPERQVAQGEKNGEIKIHQNSIYIKIRKKSMGESPKLFEISD